MMVTGLGVLVPALVAFGAIWFVVLWGSRYFGPQ